MTTPTAPTRWRRDVTVFLTGQTFSLLGSMLVQYAIMWHLTLETKSGVVLAFVVIMMALVSGLDFLFGYAVQYVFGNGAI